MKHVFNRFAIAVVFVFMAAAVQANADAGPEARGIDEYNKQNYEEAIDILSKARAENPDVPLSAFFLGMAYKQTVDYPHALPHLRDAVNLTPRIKEALVELIDVLILIGKPEHFDEARMWIEVAEKENIFPARVAFLKGQLLRQQGQTDQAVSAFEAAAQLDSSLVQACDFQIGLCCLQRRELEKARVLFEKTSLHDPESDLAVFARNYTAMIEKRLFLERPVRFALTLLGHYDTNMVLKPTDASAASGVTGEKGLATTDSFQVEYVPRFEGPFNLYARYAVLANLHEFNDNTHDLIGNSVTVQPGVTVGRVGVNLTAQYNHYLKRDPDYEAYLGQATVGPLVKTFIGKNHFFEWFGGYIGKDYADDFSDPAENRNSGGFDTYLGWFWLYSDRIFTNLKYEYYMEDADGANWDNSGHRAVAGVVFSLTDALQLQLRVDQFNQDYDNTHTLFGDKRWDRTNASSIGLAWELDPRLILLARYERTRCNSNIGIYDYTRNVTSLGAELRF